MLAIAAALLVGAGPAAADTRPQLTTDSGGRSLLSDGQLSVDRTTENCLVLSYRDLPVGPNGLGMYGVADGTGLAEFLRFTIQIGSGGGYGDCSGFSGSTVYSGSLADFGRFHSAPSNQLLLSTLDSAAGNVTLRVQLVVRDDNRAQGLTASAAFTWTVAPMATDVTTPPPPVVSAPPPGEPDPTPAEPEQNPGVTLSTPGEVPDRAATAPAPPVVTAPPPPVVSAPPPGEPDPTPAEPDPTPAEPEQTPGVTLSTPGEVPDRAATAPRQTAGSAGRKRARPVAVTSETSRPVRPVPAPGRRAEIGPTGPLLASVSEGAKPAGLGARIREAIRGLVDTVQRTAPALAKGSAFGLGTLPFMLLFLLIQKRLDERDPKLALAPTSADKFLSFNDMPRVPPGSVMA